MARPQKCRRICAEPRFLKFSPEGNSEEKQIILSKDEFEVIRLVDYEGLTHEECSQQMDISRTTVTEIYDIARKKLAEFLVNGCHLLISGGHYRLCNGSSVECPNQHCVRKKKCHLNNLNNNVSKNNKL